MDYFAKLVYARAALLTSVNKHCQQWSFSVLQAAAFGYASIYKGVKDVRRISLSLDDDVEQSQTETARPELPRRIYCM